jgi:hypothetical protein
MNAVAADVDRGPNALLTSFAHRAQFRALASPWFTVPA